MSVVLCMWIAIASGRCCDGGCEPLDATPGPWPCCRGFGNRNRRQFETQPSAEDSYPCSQLCLPVWCHVFHRMLPFEAFGLIPLMIQSSLSDGVYVWQCFCLVVCNVKEHQAGLAGRHTNRLPFPFLANVPLVSFSHFWLGGFRLAHS